MKKMNEILQALILGIVQGLTELLPISSSAHLNLIPWAFNWDIPESFDVALHFGTLLAIVLFFYKDWLKLIKGGFNQVVKKEKTKVAQVFNFPNYLIYNTYICKVFYNQITSHFQHEF